MLWNGNLAYLFMPRTATRTLNSYFADVWHGPLFGTASPAQLREIKKNRPTMNFVQPGRGHENMQKFVEYLYRYGRSINHFEKIIFVVRNPYDLVRSNYLFLQDQYALPNRSTNSILAGENSYDDFCRKIAHPDPGNWIKASGKVPENLHILRFEKLADDIRSIDDHFKKKNIPMPRLNERIKDNDKAYVLTDATEKLIYEKYRAMFDFGSYKRYSGV